MGTATEATYWLLRCEDPLTEQPVEEDFWTMAAEMADSLGVDIINSSLGYNNYDNDCSHNLQTVPDEDEGIADQGPLGLHEISTMNENESSLLHSFLHKRTIFLG